MSIKEKRRGCFVPNISVLTNNSYKVLSYMFDKKDKENLVVITQNEIGEYLKLNKGTVNTIFKVLKDNGYIKYDKKHKGRYTITDSGVKTVSLFRKSEKV